MARELHLIDRSDKTRKHKNCDSHFSSAVWQIVVADVSMSLDNVLGVAGVARDHVGELVAGLVLSVALMGLVSSQVAKFTERHPRAGYLGIAIVLYTALRMIYDGAEAFMGPIHAYV
jgi:predicted tellurium resistance membrane protein TerC